MKMQQKSPAKKRLKQVTLDRIELFGSEPLDGGFDPDELTKMSCYELFQKTSRQHLKSEHPQVRQQARNYLDDLGGGKYEVTGEIKLEGGETRSINPNDAQESLGKLFKKQGIEADQLSKIELEISKQARGGAA